MVANVRRPLFCILLGAPGAGKGTQATLLSRDLGLPHVSSGDLFREHIRAQTQLGQEARSYLDRGELVPDSITVAMVLNRLSDSDCIPGAILDGFPRTVAQAEALEAALGISGLSIAYVINLHARRETLIQRLSGRWMCRSCGASYHTEFNPPKHAAHCDECGAELYQRQDDSPETVAHRLDVYTRQTAPLQSYYRDRGTLVDIDGERGIDDVCAAMKAALGMREKVTV